jgi:tryptophanyl-tRNA synthetase
MRPTGRLHLGHFFGALSNWLNLQNARLPDGTEEYECFFFVADWHALTTHYEDTSSIAENTLQVAMDWLAVGLDPAKSTLFVQSSILEHAELHVLLSMITPLSWLERVPTYKEQIENLKDRDLGTYGFLGYPLLQSADIVIYDADFVPVGEDQVPHVEITREVVRLFNSTYRFKLDPRLFDDKEALASIGNKIKGVSGDEVPAPNVQYTPNPARIQSQDILDDHIRRVRFDLLRRAARESGYENFLKEMRPYQRYFPFSRPALREPQALLTETPRLPGTDGRRMAKSYGNAVWLSDSPEDVRAKVRNMMTDPQRQRRTDPGRPEVCPVFAYHKLFSLPETISKVDRDCRSAAIGCVDCKKLMAENLVTWIEPVQARRKEFEANPQQVWDILDAGSDKARKAAKKTMRRVREAIFKWDEAK